MTKIRFTAFGFPMLAALAQVPWGSAAAGPSAGVSERTADDVGDGLRKYHLEKDPRRRLARLELLAPTGDPRVVLALVNAANNGNGDDLDCEAADLIWWYFACPDAARHRRRGDREVIPAPTGQGFRRWWAANEADVRRRAGRLSRPSEAPTHR
jgi:hypothetical protein